MVQDGTAKMLDIQKDTLKEPDMFSLKKLLLTTKKVDIKTGKRVYVFHLHEE